MKFSINPLKRTKVKLQKVEEILKDLTDLIGVLQGVEDLGVTGDLLVVDQGLVVPLYLLGEGQEGQIMVLEVRLVGHLEVHQGGQWEVHLEGQLEDLGLEECHPGDPLEAQGDHLELEVPEDHQGGHQAACPLHGWLDLGGHLGDLLECLHGEWLPRQELAMLPSLASGLNIQHQMERGSIQIHLSSLSPFYCFVLLLNRRTY